MEDINAGIFWIRQLLPYAGNDYTSSYRHPQIPHSNFLDARLYPMLKYSEKNLTHYLLCSMLASRFTCVPLAVPSNSCTSLPGIS